MYERGRRERFLNAAARGRKVAIAMAVVALTEVLLAKPGSVWPYFFAAYSLTMVQLGLASARAWTRLADVVALMDVIYAARFPKSVEHPPPYLC